MIITNAQYYQSEIDDTPSSISATIDGVEMNIPKDPNNRHYAEILKQVEAGTLTIADAD